MSIFNHLKFYFIRQICSIVTSERKLLNALTSNDFAKNIRHLLFTLRLEKALDTYLGMVQIPEVDLEASDQAGMGSYKKVPAYNMVREEVEVVRTGSYMMVQVHSIVDLGMGMDKGTGKVLLKDKVADIQICSSLKIPG